jgi:hypothetical protein
MDRPPLRAPIGKIVDLSYEQRAPFPVKDRLSAGRHSPGTSRSQPPSSWVFCVFCGTGVLLLLGGARRPLIEYAAADAPTRLGAVAVSRTSPAAAIAPEPERRRSAPTPAATGGFGDISAFDVDKAFGTEQVGEGVPVDASLRTSTPVAPALATPVPLSQHTPPVATGVVVLDRAPYRPSSPVATGCKSLKVVGASSGELGSAIECAPGMDKLQKLLLARRGSVASRRRGQVPGAPPFHRSTARSSRW